MFVLLAVLDLAGIVILLGLLTRCPLLLTRRRIERRSRALHEERTWLREQSRWYRQIRDAESVFPS